MIECNIMIVQNQHGEGSFWFQKEIDISFLEEKTVDIMYLDDKKAIVLLETKWALIDLSNPTKENIKANSLPPGDFTKGCLLPVSKQWFGIHYGFLYLIQTHTNKIIKSVNFTDICPNFKYFHQSKKLYKINLNKFTNTFYKVDSTNQPSLFTLAVDKFFGFADEESSVITSIENQNICLTNIQNKKISKFLMPMGLLSTIYKLYPQFKQKLSLYRINESECLLGLVDSDKNEFKLLLINQDNLKSCNLLTFQNIAFSYFCTLNKTKKQLAFVLSVKQSENYNSNIFLVIYNYQKRKILLFDKIQNYQQLNKIDRGCQVAKRLDTDLTNYVEINWQSSIVRHRFRVNKNSLYFHLLKEWRRQCEDRLPSELVRRVIGVLKNGQE